LRQVKKDGKGIRNKTRRGWGRGEEMKGQRRRGKIRRSSVPVLI